MQYTMHWFFTLPLKRWHITSAYISQTEANCLNTPNKNKDASAILQYAQERDQVFVTTTMVIKGLKTVSYLSQYALVIQLSDSVATGEWRSLPKTSLWTSVEYPFYGYKLSLYPKTQGRKKTWVSSQFNLAATGEQSVLH